MANNGSAGVLYVVATPIGNLGDLSKRCIETLKTVDLVAAEDTRRTGILLREVGSNARLESYHAHSDRKRAARLVEALKSGRSVAVVTDAGTPAVSDPGADLVGLARAEGLDVIPIPGPSAVTAALSVSGFSADRYLFLGFLPRKGKARRSMLAAVAESPWTVVVFESPNRVAATLDDLSDVLSTDRGVMVGREISKLYEEYRVGTPEALAVYYRQEPVRGEVTLVIEGGTGPTEAVDPEIIESRAREMLLEGLTKKDVVAGLTAELGVARNEAYRIVTSL